MEMSEEIFRNSNKQMVENEKFQRHKGDIISVENIMYISADFDHHWENL